MAKSAEVFSNVIATETVSDNLSTSSNSEKANANPSKERHFFAWFDKNDGPVERRLILKLDLLTLSFACMGFWVCLMKLNCV